MPCGHFQVRVQVQGKTRMVDALPTTTAVQLERIVAARVGVPHGIFALYRGSKPLLGNEPVGGGGDAVELKVRGRGGGCAASTGRGSSPAAPADGQGGTPNQQQLSADVAAGTLAVSPAKLRADVAAAAEAHTEPPAEASVTPTDAKPPREPGVGASALSSDEVTGKPSDAGVENVGEEAAKTGGPPFPSLTQEAFPSPHSRAQHTRMRTSTHARTHTHTMTDTKKRPAGARNEEADKIFALLDRNDDGFVTEEEVKEYVRRMADPKPMLKSLSVSTTEEAAQKLLQLLDTSGDSLIRCAVALVHHVCRVLSNPHIVSYCILPTYGITSNCILPHHLTAPHPTEPSRLHDRDLIALLHPIVAHIMYYHIVSYRILSDLI